MHDVGLFEFFDKEYSYGISSLERIVNADKTYSPFVVEKHKKINTCLNIVFCLFVLFLCDFQIFANWNIVKIGVAFVIFDIVLGFVDNYLVNVKPYKDNTKLKDVTKYQKYVSELEKKVEELDKKKVTFAKENCEKCSYHEWYGRGNSYRCEKSLQHQCPIFQEYDWYAKELAYHKGKLEALLEEMKTEEVLSNEKVSSDYQDKLAYFKDMQIKFEHLSKKSKGLTPISKSLKNLITLLETKPIGLTFVPNTVYIYLDELQTISAKLEGLDKEQQERYADKFGKVAKALSENIEDINRRIDNYETEDIEVGLNVLFSELVKDTEDDKNV